MARFFFDIHKNDDVVSDDEGSDLHSFEAARTEAIRTLPQVAADEIPENGDQQHYAVVVRDESGRTVYTATLVYTGLRL